MRGPSHVSARIGPGELEGVYHADRDGSGVVLDSNGARWRVARAVDVGDGDRVAFVALGEGGGDARRRDATRRAAVVRVLQGAREHWVGIVERGERGYELVPYRDEGMWRVPIVARDLRGANVGDVVRAQISGQRRQGSKRGAGRVQAEILERIGRPGEPEADFRAVVWRRRLPVDFPAGVSEEAERLEATEGAALLRDRLDLRPRAFITIDPENARDHDDAVFVERGEDGRTRLWVAIADVAHYVAAGSAIDREAWRRGNSVYFPDRVIPMLPERLSSDLCSLREGVDRPVLAVEMTLGAAGEVRRARFHRAVIRSRARLTYAEANAVMEPWTARGSAAPTGAVKDQLEHLAQICEHFLARRVRAGSMDFELPESHIVLDERGMPVDVAKSERLLAHRAIEEAMLAANRAVARALGRAGMPTLYRIHERPGSEKREALADLYRRFGLIRDCEPDALDAKTLAGVLRRVRGRPEEPMIHLVTLRSMQQARYCVEDHGHFALAFESYLHFTSPIRRYSDLVVHRSLLAWLAGQEAPERGEALEVTAAQTSARERVAVAAEREMNDLKKCAFMADRVGESFEGRITGVGEQGLYITLDAYHVEGLVRISELRGYFEVVPEEYALVARVSGHRHTLGDAVRVRLESVDIIRGWINFSIESARGKKSPPGRAGRGRRGRDEEERPADTEDRGGGSPEDGSASSRHPRARSHRRERPARPRGAPSRSRDRR